jgi:hypothetical protein
MVIVRSGVHRVSSAHRVTVDMHRPDLSAEGEGKSTLTPCSRRAHGNRDIELDVGRRRTVPFGRGMTR